MTDSSIEVPIDPNILTTTVTYRDRFVLRSTTGYLCPTGLNNDIAAIHKVSFPLKQNTWMLWYLFELVGEGVGDLNAPPVITGTVKPVVRNVNLAFGEVVKLRHVYTGRYLKCCRLGEGNTYGLHFNPPPPPPKASTQQAKTGDEDEAEPAPSPLSQSKLSSNDLQHAEMDNDMWFEILPTSRVRSDGQIVRPNDEIMIRNRDHQLFVTTTKNVIQMKDASFTQLTTDDTRPQHFLLELYDPTGHARDVIDDPPQKRRLVYGQPIGLFHKDAQGYLMAPRNSSTPFIRKIPSVVERFTAISSQALFALERVDNVAGGIVQYNDHVVIKSLGTQKYIQIVDKDGEKTLQWTYNVSAVGTKFSVINASEGAITGIEQLVKMFSTIKFKSLDVDHAWMCVGDMKGETEKQLYLAPHDGYAEAYEVTDVSGLARQLFPALSFFHPLHHYIHMWQNATSLSDIHEDTMFEVKVLVESILKLVVDGELTKTEGIQQGTVNTLVQRCMVDQGYDDLVFQALCAPYRIVPVQDIQKLRENSSLYNYIHYITVLSYNILLWFAKNNEESSKRMSGMIPTVRLHLGYSVGATQALIEILTDNAVVVESMPESEIRSFIQATAGSWKRKLLTIFARLMVCGESNVHPVQELVKTELLGTHKSKVMVEYTANGIKNMTGAKEWTPWEACFEQQLVKKNYKEIINYWIALVEMLAHVARFSVDGAMFVRKFMPSPLFSVEMMFNPALSPALRVSYAIFTRYAIIEHLETIPRHIIVFEFLHMHRSYAMNYGVEHEEDLGQLVHSTIMYFKTLQTPLATEEWKENNLLTIEMLDVALELMRKKRLNQKVMSKDHNVYDNAILLESLMKLVQRILEDRKSNKRLLRHSQPPNALAIAPSTTDAPNADDELIFEILIRICLYIQLYIELEIDKASRFVLGHFHQTVGESGAAQGFFVFDSVEDHFTAKGVMNQPGHISILLDMMRAQSVNVVNEAAKALFAAHRKPYLVVECLRNVVILPGTQELQLFHAIMDYKMKMSDGLSFHYDRMAVETSTALQDLYKLFEISGSSRLKRMSQNLMRLLGVHKDVLRLMKQVQKSRQSGMTQKQHDAIMFEAMNFIAGFVDGCHVNQAMMSLYTKDILDTGADYAILFPTLAAIHRNNVEAIASASEALFEATIRRIIKEPRSVYMNFLCHVCVYDDRIYHKNISAAMALFLTSNDDWPKVFPFLRASQSKVETETRHYILTTPEYVEEREYYMATLHFHALCMRGLRSSILEVDEVIATYIDKSIPFDVRCLCLVFFSRALLPMTSDAAQASFFKIESAILHDLEMIERGTYADEIIPEAMIDSFPLLVATLGEKLQILIPKSIEQIVDLYIRALTSVKLPPTMSNSQEKFLLELLNNLEKMYPKMRDAIKAHVSRVTKVCDMTDTETVNKSLDEHLLDCCEALQQFVENKFPPCTSMAIDMFLDGKLGHFNVRHPNFAKLCEIFCARVLNAENLVFFMTLFCDYLQGVEEDNVVYIPKGYDDDVDTITSFFKDAEAMQGMMNHVGITTIMIKMTEHLEPAVRRQATKLGVRLLTGGRKNVQSTIFTNFQLTAYETFFQAVSNIITNFYDVQRNYQEGYATLEDFEVSIEETQDAMKFLQLMCEGHNTILQNYLRVQHDNVISVNLVRDTVMLVRTILRNVSTPGPDGKVNPLPVMELLEQGLESLVEYCQGPCKENQTVLLEYNSTSVLKSCFELLDKKIFSSEQFYSLLVIVLKMFLAIMEGSGEGDNPLLEIFPMSLMTRLFSIMNDMWIQCTLESSLKMAPWAWEIELEDRHDEPFTPEEMERFEKQKRSRRRKHVPKVETLESFSIGSMIYIFLSSLEPFDRTRTIYKILTKQMSYAFFHDKVAMIEIDRAGDLERVFFVLPTQFKFLQEDTKSDIQNVVRRDTPMLKLQDFFGKWGDMYAETVIYEESAQYAMLRVFINYKGYLADLSFVLSIIISLYQMFLMSHAYDSSTSYMSDEYYYGFLGMALFQIFMELWMFGGWLLLRGRVLIHQYMESVEKTSTSEKLLEPPKITNRKHYESLALIPKAFITLCILLLNEDFYISSLFAAAAPMGVLTHPVFFSIQIFRVIQRSPSLNNVVKAVTLKWQDLLATIALGVVVIFLFSMMIFYYFADTYYDINRNPELGVGFVCQSMNWCFVLNVVYGLRGGIGDRMQPPNWNDPYTPVTARLVLDFIFWVVMIIIFLNIIFGIILDTFADLRDRKQETDKDMRTVCFVCAMEATEFDKWPGGFYLHYHQDHNMWKYFGFYCHLKLKETTEYTGQESYVSIKMKKLDLSFFPQEKALMLKDQIQDEDDFEEMRELQIINDLGEVIFLSRKSNFFLPDHGKKAGHDTHQHGGNEPQGGGGGGGLTIRNINPNNNSMMISVPPAPHVATEKSNSSRDERLMELLNLCQETIDLLDSASQAQSARTSHRQTHPAVKQSQPPPPQQQYLFQPPPPPRPVPVRYTDPAVPTSFLKPDTQYEIEVEDNLLTEEVTEPQLREPSEAGPPISGDRHLLSHDEALSEDDSVYNHPEGLLDPMALLEAQSTEEMLSSRGSGGDDTHHQHEGVGNLAEVMEIIEDDNESLGTPRFR
eukprot:PhF_6_TR7937/c0_g1_i1/m.11936/K04958/ITPR1; inositol 1,4,5-triphosphate receptor type 1